MSTRNRLPPQLHPYLSLPPETALLLFTSTLACNASWLTTRFVGNLLLGENSDDQQYTPQEHGNQSEPGEQQPAILLVSWLRSSAFWKSELRRGMGIDTEKLKDRFTILDFLSTPAQGKGDPLAALESSISSALAALKSKEGNRRTVLVLDSPDTLLALHSSSLNATSLSACILRLRSKAHSTVLTCNADGPLLSAAGTENVSPTNLESASAAFAVQQAHAARIVVGVRELDTGAAKDVSGVLRVSRGGAVYDASGKEDNVEELEALYLVQRDGNVKVFGRGAVEGG